MIHTFELMTNDLFAVCLLEVQVKRMMPYLRIPRRIRIGIHVGQATLSADRINFIYANVAFPFALELLE
jgi:hypothetical protein